jgi:hypothetical protein
MMGVLQNMANANIKMGIPKKGIEYLEAILTLEKIGEQDGPGKYIKKVGGFYQQLKEFKKAGPKFRKGTNFKFEYSLLNSLGETYSELKMMKKL